MSRGICNQCPRRLTILDTVFPLPLNSVSSLNFLEPISVSCLRVISKSELEVLLVVNRKV